MVYVCLVLWSPGWVPWAWLPQQFVSLATHGSRNRTNQTPARKSGPARYGPDVVLLCVWMTSCYSFNGSPQFMIDYSMINDFLADENKCRKYSYEVCVHVYYRQMICMDTSWIMRFMVNEVLQCWTCLIVRQASINSGNMALSLSGTMEDFQPGTYNQAVSFSWTLPTALLIHRTSSTLSEQKMTWHWIYSECTMYMQLGHVTNVLNLQLVSDFFLLNSYSWTKWKRGLKQQPKRLTECIKFCLMCVIPMVLHVW